MTNKSNVEIIEEELKKIHGEYMVAKALAIKSGEYYKNQDKWRYKFFEPFASSLLSKLNKLDGETIEEIFSNNRNWITFDGSSNYTGEGIDRIIDQILTLIPPDGEVIAEGELFLSQDSGITMIKDTKFINVDEKLYKHQGKKGKLIWIEEIK